MSEINQTNPDNLSPELSAARAELDRVFNFGLTEKNPGTNLANAANVPEQDVHINTDLIRAEIDTGPDQPSLINPDNVSNLARAGKALALTAQEACRARQHALLVSRNFWAEDTLSADNVEDLLWAA